FDSAQQQYNQAATLYEQIGDKRDLARLLTSEGRLQREHGRPEMSLDLYRQAQKLQHDSGDREGEIQTINAMAVAYGAMANLGKATELYQQALAAARDTGSERLINFQLGNLAGAYTSAGKD